jgi:hypothetical protein
VLNAKNAVIIKDLGPWDQVLTITNDPAWVVEDLQHRYLAPVLTPGKRLFYLDSDRRMDELLLTWEGHLARFKGFAPLPVNKVP